MPTENRSSNIEQMVRAPVALLERIRQLLIDTNQISDFGPELWNLLNRNQPAAQHQGEPVADARDYAIEHAGFLADAADQVLAGYKAYSVAQMLKSEGGDDGDGELEDAVDAARDDLHEGLANLRGMAYEFRKRRVRSDSSANVEPAPTSDGFSAGDMADQGAKAFRDGQLAGDAMTFEFVHPDTKERRTVTVTREEVADQMDDVLFEKLVDELCQCETVGETNDLDCRCDEVAEQFKPVKPS